jgi:hypothetical protein
MAVKICLFIRERKRHDRRRDSSSEAGGKREIRAATQLRIADWRTKFLRDTGVRTSWRIRVTRFGHRMDCL